MCYKNIYNRVDRTLEDKALEDRALNDRPTNATYALPLCCDVCVGCQVVNEIRSIAKDNRGTVHYQVAVFFLKISSNMYIVLMTFQPTTNIRHNTVNIETA